MICPNCGFPLPHDREHLGARCPSCHDPLYEPPTRMARPSREGEATCYVHGGMTSVGECAKCRHQMCETCRTRWRGKILCSPCVDNILCGQPDPGFDAPRFLQARGAAGLGVATWLVGIPALLALGRLGSGGGTFAVVSTFVVLSVLLGNVLLASLAMGQAVASLRATQQYRELALTGLVLGGLYTALALGVGTLTIWQS
jgi:hypothetical protein